jgi:hypothetical protein
MRPSLAMQIGRISARARSLNSLGGLVEAP